MRKGVSGHLRTLSRAAGPVFIINTAFSDCYLAGILFRVGARWRSECKEIIALKLNQVHVMS